MLPYDTDTSTRISTSWQARVEAFIHTKPLPPNPAWEGVTIHPTPKTDPQYQLIRAKIFGSIIGYEFRP